MFLFQYLNSINDYILTYLLTFTLVASGLFFTFKTKFIQFRLFAHAFSLFKGSSNKDSKTISSFQAMSTSLASLVGTGNIAGIAIAIYLGGPGAIFWMWIIGFFGLATSILENTLGQVYKQKNQEGNFFGGPAYYIKLGLNNRFLSFSFALLMIFTYSFAFNSIQSNTIAYSLKHAFSIDRSIMAVIIAILTSIIIVGGIKRIALITSILVPVMGVLYLFIALIVILLNITNVPGVFAVIVKSAFGLEPAFSGAFGYTITQAINIGIKRGLFTNEAGLGSVPNISASALVKHPVRQGLLGMVTCFLVTFVMCTATALIILLSNVYSPNNGIIGVELVQSSLQQNVGDIAVYVVAVAVFLFAFSSIIGNYSYAESNLHFITKNNLWFYIIRIFTILVVFVGAISELQVVWLLGDVFMVFLALANISAVFMLLKVAIKTIEDYTSQLQHKAEPVFEKKNIKKLSKDITNVW